MVYFLKPLVLKRLLVSTDTSNTGVCGGGQLLEKKPGPQSNGASDLVMYLDLHGHSRKTNLFAYGCSNYTDYRFFTVRMYPKILSILMPDAFSYRCCRLFFFKEPGFFKIGSKTKGSALEAMASGGRGAWS